VGCVNFTQTPICRSMIRTKTTTSRPCSAPPAKICGNTLGSTSQVVYIPGVNTSGRGIVISESAGANDSMEPVDLERSRFSSCERRSGRRNYPKMVGSKDQCNTTCPGNLEACIGAGKWRLPAVTTDDLI
jgi:hypothetical protein